MSENKLKSRNAIDAELKKTKAELVIAKHKEAKLRNQIKDMTEKERRHRSIPERNKNLQTVPFYGTLLKILRKGAVRTKYNFMF